MRATVHAVDAADFTAFRPLFGRRRVIPHDHPVPLWPGNGGTRGTVLIDGVWDANWQITRDALTITALRPLTADEESVIAEEGTRLAAFTSPDTATPDIRFTPG